MNKYLYTKNDVLKKYPFVDFFFLYFVPGSYKEYPILKFSFEAMNTFMLEMLVYSVCSSYVQLYMAKQEAINAADSPI